MQSVEIVRRAIRFQKPPRLPVRFPCFDCSDIEFLWPVPGQTLQSQTTGEDLWGCIWEHTNVQNLGQVTGHPLKTITDIDTLKTPRYDDDRYYIHLPDLIEQLEKTGTYLLVGIFMVLFERMHSLYGFTNVMIDLIDNPEGLHALAGKITTCQLSLIRNIRERFGSRVHGFHMTDDWGTQKAPFISSGLWLDFFLPYYRRIFDAIHEGGYDVWVHSCGKVNDIIEGYIKAGVDVVNLQQPRALGIEEIGKRYKKRIAFESLCDIQQTLPKGDADEIAVDARLLMKHWASPDGGFIFSDYGDDAAIGVKDPSVKLTMYNTFSKLSTEVYGKELPKPRTTS